MQNAYPLCFIKANMLSLKTETGRVTLDGNTFRQFDGDTVTEKELTDAEGMPVEEKALRYVAKAGDGSMRDALSLLDQCIAFHLGKELTYDKVLDVLGAVDTEVFSRLLRHVLKRDVIGCIELLEEIVRVYIKALK